MPCDTVPTLTTEQKLAQEMARKKLRLALANGAVELVIGPQGAVAFKNWPKESRGGLTDVCAFRRLSAEMAPELRAAVREAERKTGRRVNPEAVQKGIHSHNGGTDWSAGH